MVPRAEEDEDDEHVSWTKETMLYWLLLSQRGQGPDIGVLKAGLGHGGVVVGVSC